MTSRCLYTEPCHVFIVANSPFSILDVYPEYYFPYREKRFMLVGTIQPTLIKESCLSL